MKMFRLLAPALGLFAFALPSMSVTAAAQAATQEQQFTRVEVAIAQDVVEEVFVAFEEHSQANTLNEKEQAIEAALEEFMNAIEAIASNEPKQDANMEQMFQQMQQQMDAISAAAQKSADKMAPLFIELQTKYPVEQCNEKAVSATLAQQLVVSLAQAMMQDMLGGF